MSTNTFPVLFSVTQLTDVASTLYTVPSNVSNQTLQDLQIKFANTGTGSDTVTAYAVPDGGSATLANAICVDLAIPPNDYVLIPVERLPAGATIQALASTTSVINAAPIGGKLHTP